jgi:hypothetical protein
VSIKSKTVQTHLSAPEKAKSLSEEDKQFVDWVKDIKSFQKSLHNDAKVFQQLKLRGKLSRP